VVGVVGATGSGKSTLMNLLPRFYEPQLGRILIDGIDICDFKLTALRSQIAFVLQDSILFPGTIRDNIAYGRPGASDEDIMAAAAIANADEFIARMPQGYQSLVGEHGNTLSGGQRQRIAIARAVVRNSPILVLDEPTAALDLQSERLVIEALQRLMRGRTVIMIAHRLNTVAAADNIIVLNRGMVAEQGTYNDLISSGGLFAELSRIQRQSESAQTADAA
jgi:subfamily B ATP-binding cassette protein MsbA